MTRPLREARIDLGAIRSNVAVLKEAVTPAAAMVVVKAGGYGHGAEEVARAAVDGGADWLGVVDVEEAEALDPSPYAVVVVGGSIHVNGHQPALRAWLGRFGEALDPARTALFSVSLTAADDSDEGREAAGEYVRALATDAGVTPALASAFAGALQYREYPLPTRVLVKLIARHRGLSTDASIDADYTDWAAVDAFADEVAGLVPRAVAA